MNEEKYMLVCESIEVVTELSAALLKRASSKAYEKGVKLRNKSEKSSDKLFKKLGNRITAQNELKLLKRSKIDGSSMYQKVAKTRAIGAAKNRLVTADKKLDKATNKVSRQLAKSQKKLDQSLKFNLASLSGTR